VRGVDRGLIDGGFRLIHRRPRLDDGRLAGGQVGLRLVDGDARGVEIGPGDQLRVP
jgi:hypothetical protein